MHVQSLMAKLAYVKPEEIEKPTHISQERWNGMLKHAATELAKETSVYRNTCGTIVVGTNPPK